jgi:hypothetical protein
MVSFPGSTRSLELFGILLYVATTGYGPAGVATSVTLTFQGPTRAPLAITHAQLLVTAWGVAERYDLAVDGSVLRLDLEATRPEFADRFTDEKAFIYIKAAGYPPLMSEAFTWPAPNVPTVIDFRNGRRAVIAQGEHAKLTVSLRASVPRRIRLVDNSGRTVSGTKVETAAYWNAPNHCGFLNGRDVLATGVSDEDGVIQVPDLDGPYAFGLLEPYIVFADADNSLPASGSPTQGLIASLSQLETNLIVRRYERRRLEINIVDKAKPLPNAVLWSDMALGVCGAGYGKLGTADSSGRIVVEAFYPEMWQRFWVCAGARQAWVMPDDGKLPATIDVSATPGAKQNWFASLCGR